MVGFDVNHVDFRRDSNSPYGGESVVDPYTFAQGRFINLAGTRTDFLSRTGRPRSSPRTGWNCRPNSPW